MLLLVSLSPCLLVCGGGRRHESLHLHRSRDPATARADAAHPGRHHPGAGHRRRHPAHHAHGEQHVSRAVRPRDGSLAGSDGAPGRAAFSTEWVGSFESIHGVKETVPSIRGAASVVGLPRRGSGGRSPRTPAMATIPVVGVGEGLGVGVGRLLEGEPLAGNDDALVDQTLAERLKLAPGQTIEILTSTGLAPLRLAGIVSPGRSPSSNALSSGGLLVVSLPRARRLFDLPDKQVNCLGIRLEDESDSERIQSAVSRKLPPGLTVRAPGGHGSLAHSTLMAAEQGLSALGVLAVITSTFVIFNTFLLELGERRKQLALMKTLGATRWQVMGWLTGEAMLLGVAGALAGCALGTGLALLLLALMERFLGISLPPLHFAPGPYLLAGLLGPGTTLATACLPAWRAACRPALDWLLPHRGRERGFLPGGWPVGPAAARPGPAHSPGAVRRLVSCVGEQAPAAADPRGGVGRRHPGLSADSRSDAATDAAAAVGAGLGLVPGVACPTSNADGPDGRRAVPGPDGDGWFRALLAWPAARSARLVWSDRRCRLHDPSLHAGHLVLAGGGRPRPPVARARGHRRRRGRGETGVHPGRGQWPRRPDPGRGPFRPMFPSPWICAKERPTR